jgi:hypothetical protein
MPSARKLDANVRAETMGRYGVFCWQGRKGSRSLRSIPFMQKLLPSRASRRPRRSRTVAYTGPQLSHPMTGGPGPASQWRGLWRRGRKAESEPPEPHGGLE